MPLMHIFPTYILKEIAEKLQNRRSNNKKAGNPAGYGCPFMLPVKGNFCRPCDILFTSREWVGTKDCPCHKLSKNYIIRRCRQFIKEVQQ